MKLGVANKRGSQGICKVWEGCSCRDVFQNVRDLLGLAEVEVLDVAHYCREDMRCV
jgi:hypothetical protein